MPKDPKKNLQRYQVQGGHLNEFEYQERQGKFAEHSVLPFGDQSGQPGLSQADHVAAVTAEAHEKVQRRKRTGTARAGGVQKAAPGKKSANKGAKTAARKSPRKSSTKRKSGTKKLVTVTSAKKSAKKSSRKVAKSTKKTTKGKAATKRK